MGERPEQQREPTRKSFPNQQNVRPDGSPPGRPPEGSGGSTGGAAQLPASPQPQAEGEQGEQGEQELPGRHAPLDQMAKERGVEWSRDDLTVAEKQAELGG